MRYKERLRFILLAISILFIIIGIYREEVLTVLMKAINICLECVGIG
ncbi:MAG TPA: CD1871A family CXXC motif-containing protein [Tissierellaceae bacterium]